MTLHTSWYFVPQIPAAAFPTFLVVLQVPTAFLLQVLSPVRDSQASSSMGQHWLQQMQVLQLENEALRQSITISQENGAWLSAQLHACKSHVALLLQRGLRAGAGNMHMAGSSHLVSLIAPKSAMPMPCMLAAINQTHF